MARVVVRGEVWTYRFKDPDHLQCVDRAKLIRRLGRLSPEGMREVCSALAVATGCD